MAGSVYSIESDKLFLRCDEVGLALELYEIDNLHLTPVQEKHFTLVGVVSRVVDNVEVCPRYKAIRISDREIIEGHDLERLTDDLFYLGMMVNREGLCFLKQGGSSGSVEEGKVNYYRIFDQFDWSKYHVRVSVNTSWVCNDVMTGRPMLDGSVQMMFDKELQVLETKHQHMEELMELKVKHIDDLDELKHKHLAELAQVKHTFMHSKEIIH